MKVLLIAFAAREGFGSEPGLGWHTLLHLSKLVDLTVITESENKKYLQNAPNGVEFIFVDFAAKQNLIWDQGNWLFYYYYRKWQKDAYNKVLPTLKNEKFHVIHHLNFIGFRELGEWYREKKIPVIYGPLGGFGHASIKLLVASRTPWTAIIKECLKLLLNYMCFLIPRVRKGLATASIVLAATPEAADQLKRYFRIRGQIRFIPETGIDHTALNNATGLEFNDSDGAQSRSTDILYCGKPAYRKGYDIFLDVLNAIDRPLHVNVIGFKFEETSKLQREKLHNIKHDLNFTGKIEHSKVQVHMRSAKILFFPSLHEGTSHAVMEGMANGCTIICFDVNSHGYLVKKYRAGYVVSKTLSYSQIIVEFKLLITECLESDWSFSAPSVFIEQHTWSSKATVYKKIYDEITQI